MDIVWNDPENVSHLKSIALTVLELLAFNAPTVCLTGLLHTHTHRYTGSAKWCTIRQIQYLHQFTSFTWQR